MFHIALVSKHTGEKTYLETFKGVKSTWITEKQAQAQIDGLKYTCGYGSREPVNFDYVIEPCEPQNYGEPYGGDVPLEIVKKLFPESPT